MLPAPSRSPSRRRAALLAATGRIVASASLVASVILVAAGPAGAAVRVAPEQSTYSGSLTATGVCPYDYEYETTGQSWASAGYTGTLSGFTPDTTYYVYDDNGDFDGYSPAAVTSGKLGTIGITDALLHLPGPRQDGAYPFGTTSIPISISTEKNRYEASPPAGQIYRPPTSLAVSAICSPWVADGGTTVLGDGTSQMSSEMHGYNFGENLFKQTGAFEITRTSVGHGGLANQVFWSTNTTGSGNRIVMQTDGNLVVYSPDNIALWQSHTYPNPGAYLVMQSDRNLVIYSAEAKALWQAGTSVG